jgi:multidrug resistance protein, MATE family
VLKRELRELFKLAGPIAAAQAGSVLMSAVDAAIVGRLGASELAAVGLGNSLFFTLSTLGLGITLAIDPLASQAVGASDLRRARTLLWQGIWLALGVSVVLSIVMFVASRFIGFLGVEPHVTRLCLTYLDIRLLSLAPTLLFIVGRAYLQAFHITAPMVWAMVIGNVFNFFADLLLVFGGGNLPAWTGPLQRVPALGVAGAAVATLLGSFLQLWILARAIRKVDRPADYVRRPDRDEMRHALRIGMPVGLQMGVEYGIFALVGLIAGRLGAAALAAHQVALTLASFTFTLAVGVGAAASVRVGNAIGAGDVAATRLAGIAGFIGGVIVMGVSALLMITMPGFFAGLITNQREVLAVAVPLLVVAAVFQLADGVQAVGAGVLRGAGDTKFILWANLFGHWAIGLPCALAFGVALKMGIVGLWWGLCVGLFAVAFILFRRFRKLSATLIAPIGVRTAL